MDPITMAIGAGAAITLGAGLRAYGSYLSGQMQGDSYEFSAKQARNNIDIAKFNKEQTIKDTAKALETLAMQEDYTMSLQVSEMASKGVRIGKGTTFDMLQDTIYKFDLQELDIKDTSEAMIWKIDKDISMFKQEERFYKKQAKKADKASKFGAGGGLLSGLGSLGGLL